MATAGNYASALGQMAKDTFTGTARGLVGAAKGAALSEMPGIAGAYAFGKSLSSRASSIAAQSRSGASPAASASGAASPNVVNLEMVRQLRMINANTQLQNKMIKGQLDMEAAKAQFEEEKEREKSIRDEALLNAIKNMKGGGTAANDPDKGGGLLGNILSSLLGSAGSALLTGVAAGAGLMAFAKPIAKFLVKAAGFVLRGALRVIMGPVGWAWLAYEVGSAIYDIFGDGPSGGGGGKKPSGPSRQDLGGGYDPMGNATGAPTGGGNTGGGGGGGPVPTAASKTAIKWRIPLRSSYTVTSEHDEQRGPPKYKKSYRHQGIDLAIYQGAPVVATADGIVTVNSKNDNSGNFLMMDHGDGFTSVYAHLLLASAGAGTRVKAGDVIGYVGSTGNSTGPHLHFEIRENGKSQDPRKYITFGPLAKVSKPDTTPPVADRAGDVTPKQTTGVPTATVDENAKKLGGGGNGYVETSPGYFELKEDIDRRNAQSGTGLRLLNRPSDKPVAVVDKEANKKLQQIQKGQDRTTKAVGSGTVRATKMIWRAEQQILQDTNNKFIKDFRTTTTRAITLALKQALFPKGVGVSQSAAMGQMYRGQQLGRILNLDRRMNSLFTDILGKQYGPMFAPVFSNMAKGYLEVGARAAGRAIFGGLGGMDANGSNILSGQILGNYAAGKKKLAFEQLLYGATGQATGVETMFAKFGFQNPMQGAQYIADTLGAAISDPLNQYMGDPNARPTRIFDPRLNGGRGGYVLSGANVYGGTERDAYGRIMGTGEGGLDTGGAYRASYGQYNPTGPYGQYLPPGASGYGNMSYGNAPDVQNTGNGKGLTIYDPNWEDQTAFNKKSQEELDRYNAQQAYRDYESISQQELTNQLLQRGVSGSGTNPGGAFGGGGGFFNGGTAMGQLGNMALGFGQMALTQKAVQAMGIKNPYMNMLASAALNKGISWAGGKAWNAFMGTETGAALGNWWGTTMPSWLGGYDAATMADLALGQAMTANAAGGTATAVAAGQTATAATAAAAGEGFLASAAAAAPYVFLAIAAFAIFDSIFGGDDWEPDPKIERSIYVNGNNNANALGTTYAQDDSYAPAGWIRIADELARVAFNATKAMMVATGKTSPFDYVTFGVHKFDTFIAVGTGDPKGKRSESQYLERFGEVSKMNTGTVASKIVAAIQKKFNEAYAAETTKIDEAARKLQGTSYDAIAKNLLPSLKKDLAPGLEKGIYADNVAESARIERLIAVSKLNPNNHTDSEGNYTNKIWSMKEGKYVDRPITGYTVESDGEGGTYKRPIYDANAIMIDEQGRPVYDLNKSGMLDVGDFTSSATNPANLVKASNTAVNSSNLVVNPNGTVSTSAGGATVVSNSGNVIDNSTKTSVTNITRGTNPHGDLLRSAGIQTGIIA